MVKFKIFFGDNCNRADELANYWLLERPNIEILQMKYQHTTEHLHHSICIMYKEN